MFKCCVEVALASCVLAAAIPILALSTALHLIQTWLSALADRLTQGSGGSRVPWIEMRAASEFRYERAIEAYEQLIDATLAGTCL